jgi:hypothetical protein
MVMQVRALARALGWRASGAFSTFLLALFLFLLWYERPRVCTAQCVRVSVCVREGEREGEMPSV